ncbi:MAG TPA: N-acetylmuramoyl-L-alanine amidase [Planctomycetota bacterium]|nr:N-acetylmuramoyl-L-alanine amidase [Planctomycetota bacterium]
MSSLLRFLAIGLVLIAMVAQGGCQMRGDSTSTAPYHPDNVVRHTVQVGDTLSSIAAKYGVSVATLVDANSIRDRNLRPGTVLQVPGGRLILTEPTPTPPVVIAPNQPPVTEDWFVPRSQWTKQPVVLSRTVPMGGTPNRITVHHSGDKDDLNADSVTWLRQVDLNHIKGINHPEPWACIGYHFIIDPSGRVYEGRPLKFQGAHAGNPEANFLNIGICLMGNFDVQHVPPAQRSALLSVLDRLCLQYGISRAAVYGHKHFKLTECPGRFLSQIIDAYTRREGGDHAPDGMQAAIPGGATRLGAVLPTHK